MSTICLHAISTARFFWAAPSCRNELASLSAQTPPSQALRPQIFVSVPRLWNRIYDRVMGAIRDGNPLSRTLFERVSFCFRVAAGWTCWALSSCAILCHTLSLD